MANLVKRMRIYQIAMVAVVSAGALAGLFPDTTCPDGRGVASALGSSGELMMP